MGRAFADALFFIRQRGICVTLQALEDCAVVGCAIGMEARR